MARGQAGGGRLPRPATRRIEQSTREWSAYRARRSPRSFSRDRLRRDHAGSGRQHGCQGGQGERRTATEHDAVGRLRLGGDRLFQRPVVDVLQAVAPGGTVRLVREGASFDAALRAMTGSARRAADRGDRLRGSLRGGLAAATGDTIEVRAVSNGASPAREFDRRLHELVLARPTAHRMTRGPHSSEPHQG